MQPKDLGKNIRELRVAKKLTQQEFAELLIVAPQTISKWERGVSYPDVFYLQKMSKILDVSILEFLEDDEKHDEADYYIAIDGGGTKTEFVLFKEDGEVASRALYGTSNPNLCGMKTTLSILQKGIDNLLSLKKTPKRIFAGIAGAASGNHKETIRLFLKRTYPLCKINIDSDIKNIIGLAHENGKCITAIMGTGAVVYGWNGTDLKRVGGWGYLFGDKGSGFDIGREVLIAAYAYGDGLAPSSEMSRLVEERLGGPVSDYTSEFYSKGQSYIASFCPIAFEAMAAGDKLAEEIIKNNAAQFANKINHMYRLGEYGNRVIISGGLAMHNETLIELVKEELDKGIIVEIPTYPPIFGAMRSCLELGGADVDYDAFEAKFVESYNQK